MQVSIYIHTWNCSKKYTIIPIEHDNWAKYLVCRHTKEN